MPYDVPPPKDSRRAPTRGPVTRLLGWMDAEGADAVGTVVEWLLVILVLGFVALIGSVARSSHSMRPAVDRPDAVTTAPVASGECRADAPGTQGGHRAATETVRPGGAPTPA